LAITADSHRFLDYFSLMSWSDGSWQAKNPIVTCSNVVQTRFPLELAKTADNRLIAIYENGERHKYYLVYEHDGWRYHCRDFGVLKKFIELRADASQLPIEWGLPMSILAPGHKGWW